MPEPDETRAKPEKGRKDKRRCGIEEVRETGQQKRMPAEHITNNGGVLPAGH